jgi:branched-chain amino acid transport system ATP-binding protein
MLEVREIHTYYGRSHVLEGVSLTVGECEVVTLLGRNGAGKTTTLRSIMNLTPIQRGEVSFDGRPISRTPTYVIARLGLALVPSGRRLFSALTVRQNLLLRMQLRERSQPAWTLERVHEVFPALATLGGRLAASLSGGEQQMLKLGCALIANPKLLLLDEPTEGLAPKVVGQLGEWLRVLKDRGLSILLCEQNALFALSLADRGYILEKGRVRYSAPANALRESPEVRAYLAV